MEDSKPSLKKEGRLFSDFYRGKRVLVTGAAGVKGTWLCHLLVTAGAIVTGVDVQSPDPGSNFSLSGLGDRMDLIQGDINDKELMASLLQQNDCLFHLAAIALVHDCKRRPEECYRANTLGTVNALEAFKRSPIARYAVFVTTDKVYRPKDGLWVESDPLFASGPYAVSKACAEQAIADCDCVLKGLGKRYGIGRAGNVLVGGDLYSSSRTQGAGRVFVDCFEALADGRAPVIFSPKHTRPYTYGLDVLTGYMSLMAQLDRDEVSGEAFNFGPHEQVGIPNSFLATKICEVWGGGIQWKSGALRDEPFQTQALSWQKAQTRLGWFPAYTLGEGILDSAAWYRAWAGIRNRPSKGALQSLTLELIEKHQESAKRVGTWWAAA